MQTILSHLLPSTPTQRVVREKILWHYLNGFVSIGEFEKGVKKCNNCTLFETSFSYSSKKIKKIEKSFSWEVFVSKNNTRKMYEVMDTRTRLYFYDHFSSFVLNWASFRNNLNQKSFFTRWVQRHKIFNLFSTQVPKCLCGKPELDEISVYMKEFFWRRIKKMCGKLFSSSNTCFQLLPIHLTA